MSQFDLPKTIQEARARMLELDDATRSIEAQLADHNRTTEDGSRLSMEAYNTWRRSALHALNRKRTEYRFLKQWVKDRESDLTRTDLAGTGIDAQDPARLLLLAYRICRKHLDWAILPPTEKAILDTVRQYLRNHAGARAAQPVEAQRYAERAQSEADPCR